MSAKTKPVKSKTLPANTITEEDGFKVYTAYYMKKNGEISKHIKKVKMGNREKKTPLKKQIRKQILKLSLSQLQGVVEYINGLNKSD